MKIEINFDGSNAKCSVKGVYMNEIDTFRTLKLYDASKPMYEYTETEVPRETYKLTVKLNDNT